MRARLDPSYYREWRAAHPGYREREAARNRARKAAMTPEQRRLDRGKPKPKPKLQQKPLPVLMPGLQRGAAISFWEDELRLDLAQEMALALIEGRDTQQAVTDYKKREHMWRAMTCPIFGDINQ